MNFGEVFNMKKRFLFPMLLLASLFLCSCDGNFGVQEIFGTYLIIKNPNNSKIMVQCKSEKLKIPSLSTCSEVTDEEIFQWVKDEKLVNNDESFNVFRIPIGGSVFNDTKNIRIYFQAEVENQMYIAELNINELQANMPYLTKESVLLENSNGDILDSVFTYCLHTSI